MCAGENNGYEEADRAIVAAFVILFMAGFLVHSVWLGATYRQMRDARRHKLWGIRVSDALYSILFV
jgi:hypothetical protein